MRIIIRHTYSRLNTMSKIILYIATSKDYFIADKNGGIGWLPHPKDDHDLKVVGYKDLMKRIDIILMGSTSYKQIVGFGDWGWPDKQAYVFTSKSLESNVPYISITHDSPVQCISTLKHRKSKKDIWLLGGAELAKSFAQQSLIDEIILTIVPQNLGEGIPLGLNLDDFNLASEKSLMDGMTQRVYLREKA
jgi:dihydrofolate reductase